MKKIIISIMLLSLTLTATGIKNTISGSLETILSKSDRGVVKAGNLIINNDTIRDRDKFVTSIAIELANGPQYNTNVKTNVGNVNLYRFNELYYTRYIDNGISLSVGLFPFKNGRFYEYGYNGHRTGVGIYTLTDAVLQGAVITKKFKNQTIQFGSLVYEKYFKSFKDYEKGGSEITLDSHKDSSFNFISYSNEVNKWYYNATFSKIGQVLNGKKIIDTNTATIAMSYNDDTSSGRTYYGLFTYSSSKGDTANILSGVGRSSSAVTHFDEFKTNGYFYLLGAKQEIDSFVYNRDLVIGLEYMYRKPGFHALLAGKPLSRTTYSDIGSMYNAFIGLRLDKDTLIKLRYYKYDSEGESTKGILSTTHTSDFNNDQSQETFSLELYIDF